jgi:hypothetical protein
MSRAVVSIGTAAVLLMVAGGAVIANAASKASPAKACISHTGVLSLIKHGKCATHSSR